MKNTATISCIEIKLINLIKLQLSKANCTNVRVNFWRRVIKYLEK